jgi:hypothetical protein
MQMVTFKKKTSAVAQDLPSLQKVLPAFPGNVLEYEPLSKNLSGMGAPDC